MADPFLRQAQGFGSQAALLELKSFADASRAHFTDSLARARAQTRFANLITPDSVKGSEELKCRDDGQVLS